MKAARPYPKIIITPKGEAALTGGHPWVYEGEVTAVDGAAEDGGLVDVVSRRGSWLGCGFCNSRSKIRVPQDGDGRDGQPLRPRDLRGGRSVPRSDGGPV